MIRVLLADDEELIRIALAALLGLEPDLEVVAQAADGRAAVDAALAHRPDVAVVDLQMSTLDGLQVAAELGRAAVLRGGDPDRAWAAAAPAAGAGRRGEGVPAQGIPGRDARRRDPAAHAGDRYVDPVLAADALTAPECPLTPRELDVLRLAEYDTPVSVIARRTHLSSGTVRNYLAATVSKLGASSRAEAYRIARDHGWL